MTNPKSPPQQRRLLASVSLRTVAAAVMCTGAVLPAAAQAAEEQQRDVVVVTGYRAGLAAAVETKRNESGVVDAIVADDIADFPDLNLAEAIQRVPGVAIDRDAGEGRQITVRGLSPDFSRVRINGLEAMSTTGATDSSGGANRSRAFDFNTFASELFQSIIIRKTQSAEVDEGSLGATIDLRTARPFDHDGFTYAVSAQGGWNDLAKEFYPRLAGLITNQSEDGTFGWLVSAAYSNRELLEEGHSTVRWQNANSFGGCFLNDGATPCTGAQTTAVNNAFHPRIPRFGRLEHEQERLGLTGALQFRPTSVTEINLEALASRVRSTRNEQFLENFAFSRGGSATPALIGKPAMIVRDFEIDADNNLIWGVFDNNDIYVEHRYDELETDFTQVTLSFEHAFGDRFSVDGLIGSARSEFSNPIQSTILFTAFDTPGFSYDYRQNNRVPTINWGFDVTDPTNFLFTEYRDRPNSVDNTYDTIQLSGTFEITPDLKLRAGVNWKGYEFDVRESRRDVLLPAASWAPATAAMSQMVTGFGKGLGGSGNFSSWVIPNVKAVANMIDLYNQPLNPQSGDIRSVAEDDLGGYVQLGFQSMLAGMPVRGDIGVRYVQTETEATGIISGTQVTVKNEYTDTLPSLNVAFDVTDNLVARFGASKVMSRPSLGALTPGGTISGTTYTVSYGNPLLNPFRANNYDFSLEWYFPDEGMIALALFHKDIGSFVARGTETIPFSATGLPASAVAVGSPLAADLAANIDPLMTVTRNVNGVGGDLRGFEIQYQQPFSFLPGIFENFGTVLNYTYVDSDVNYGAAGSNQLLGLSKNSYNATLYYEDERFGARVSVNSRDKFLTQFPGRNGNDLEGKARTTNIDAALRYKLNDNVELTFDAINLTDEFNDQFVDTASRASVYHHTGREYLFGVRYRN